MEHLHNGYTLDIPSGVFPLSTDSMLLADFVQLPREARVLDLGSGCGTLGVLLCAGTPSCSVTGVELDPAAHHSALENIRRNRLEARMTSICDDLQRVNRLFPAGSFQCCVSNPPYFSGGPASVHTPMARKDDGCQPEALFQAAAWALQYGGDFFLVHKPEKLAVLCACAAGAGLQPKKLRMVRHRPEAPVALILLQCRKGGKAGLLLEEASLHDRNGIPSDYYRKIYHL